MSSERQAATPSWWEGQSRTCQHVTLADLSELALAGAPLPTLLARAAERVAASLGAEHVAVLELQSDGSTFVFRAGHGWQSAALPDTIVSPSGSSLAGLLLQTGAGRPVLVDDVPRESRFAVPPTVLAAGVLSGVAAPIRGRERPFGLLAVGANRRQAFAPPDAAFLQAAANLLGAAIVREQVEAQLRSANQSLRVYARLVDSSPDRIAIVDRDYVYHMVNPTCARMQGRPVAAIVGSTVAEVLGADVFEGLVRPHLDRCFAGEPTQHEAWFTFPAAGRRYLEVRYYPIRGAEQVEYAVVVGRDVTERKRAEDTRDEFLSLAAHELRTPLTNLKGYTRMLLRHGAHDAWEERLFQIIGAQGDRLAHLVQTLLDVSEIRSGALVLRQLRFDLSELVRDTVRLVQAGAPQHRLSVASPASVVVEADRRRLQAVIFHLLDNAVKYSPGGGPVEVSVRTAEGEAVVEVRDHGLGIPREKQTRLFDAFYQVSPMVSPTTGMGLGLYFSREVISRHGGRIWFESEEGQGSTFGLSLHFV